MCVCVCALLHYLALISMCVREVSRTKGITLKGRVMSLVVRYFMSSYSPSGGMKLMLRSLSNLLSLTHCQEGGRVGVGREGGRERGRERGREGGREGGRDRRILGERERKIKVEGHRIVIG